MLYQLSYFRITAPYRFVRTKVRYFLKYRYAPEEHTKADASS